MQNKSRLRPPPPPVTRETDEPTDLEAWYLECLRRWVVAYGRAPMIRELTAFCKRSISPVFSALVRLEEKGHVRRTDDRRFIPVNLNPPEAT